jgi:hypothetical protein
MKQYMLFLSGIALCMASCTKRSGDKGDGPADPLKDSVVNVISFTGADEPTPYDAIRSVSFLKYKEISSGKINAGDCNLLFLEKTYYYPYKVRFLDSRALMHPTKVYYAGAGSGNIVVRFAINDSLKGKPVMEVYDEDARRVYRRFIADKDSCAIEVFAGWLGNASPLDTAAVRSRYEHLLKGLDTTYFELYPGSMLP